MKSRSAASTITSPASRIAGAIGAFASACMVGALLLLPAAPTQAAPATEPAASAPTASSTQTSTATPAATPTTAPAAGEPADKGKPAKLADIHHLLELTGTMKFGTQGIDQIVTQLRYYNPDIPNDVWDQAKKEANPDQLTEQIVQIYDAHLSDDEIKDLIRFYDSPTGRKLTQLLPEINLQQAQVSRQWFGASVGKIVQMLRGKGFNVRIPGQSPPPENPGSSGGNSGNPGGGLH